MNKEVTITLDGPEFIVPRLTVRQIHEVGPPDLRDSPERMYR